jgi:2-polyprenyl-3-methyl-5-hydroxy-6-metoxy-1,4-benzoquinol methylase
MKKKAKIVGGGKGFMPRRAKRRKVTVKAILKNMSKEFEECKESMSFRTPLQETLDEIGRTDIFQRSSKIETNNKTIDWNDMPPSLNMFNNAKTLSGRNRGKRKKDEKRQERKKRQCEAFASLISVMNLPHGSTVVDFGCGSCGLTLPLAHTFPGLYFVGVDINSKALVLMEERAKAANQTNVSVHCGTIEAYTDKNIKDCVSLVISLHACGSASDASITQAVNMNVPYIVAPCCIGKVKFNMLNNSSNSNNTKNYYKQKDSSTNGGNDNKLNSINQEAIVKKDGYVNHASELLSGDNTRCVDILYPRSKWLTDHLQLVIQQRNLEIEEQLSQIDGDNNEKTSGVVNNHVNEDYNDTLCIIKLTNIGLYSDIASSADYSSTFVNVAGNDDEYYNNNLTQTSSRTSVLSTPKYSNRDITSKYKTISDKTFYEAASAIIGIDRNKWASETAGYVVRLCTMPGLHASAKTDVLVGWGEGRTI